MVGRACVYNIDLRHPHKEGKPKEGKMSHRALFVVLFVVLFAVCEDDTIVSLNAVNFTKFQAAELAIGATGTD